MKSIITNVGSSITAEAFRKSIQKFVLIGSRSENDTNLINILENNSITDTNINNQSNITNYIITQINDIDSSMVTNDKTLVVSVNLNPGFIDSSFYVYAIALLDDIGNIYTISVFAENFNSIAEAGEIITLRFKLTGSDVLGNEFNSISDETNITRREFIEWANNHNHDKEYVTIRHLNDVVSEIDQIKENKGTIGRLEDIKSLNNNNIVNVLNEIIENLGNVNDLKVATRDSIVSAINEIYSIIGEPKRLSKFDNIIESLEELRTLVKNSSGGIFLDGVRVEDVEWSEKADLSYVGDINLYHGNEKGSIVDSLNEIYDETIGNNSKIHKIIQITPNTNYKIFDKSQDYKGLMKVTTFKNSIINSYFEVELNTTPETIKIKNVSIKDNLLNVGIINNDNELINYIYGLSIVYNDKNLYLSVYSNEDLDGNILYDKIYIDFIKVDQQSNLSEEPFSTEGSIAIREGSGNYVDDAYKNIKFNINKFGNKYSLLDISKKFDAKITFKNDNNISSSFYVKSDGMGDYKLYNQYYRNLNNLHEGEYISDNLLTTYSPIFKSSLFETSINKEAVGYDDKITITLYNKIKLPSEIEFLIESPLQANIKAIEEDVDDKTKKIILFSIGKININATIKISCKWFEKNIRIRFIEYRPTSKQELKDLCDNVDIDLSLINTIDITDMSGLFENSTRTSNQFSGIENWNVSNVTNMSNMFKNAINFNSNIENWNVSNVTNMSNMFDGASSFNIDLSKWDINRHVDISNIFEHTTNNSIESWLDGNIYYSLSDRFIGLPIGEVLASSNDINYSDSAIVLSLSNIILTDNFKLYNTYKGLMFK